MPAGRGRPARRDRHRAVRTTARMLPAASPRSRPAPWPARSAGGRSTAPTRRRNVRSLPWWRSSRPLLHLHQRRRSVGGVHGTPPNPANALQRKCPPSAPEGLIRRTGPEPRRHGDGERGTSRSRYWLPQHSGCRCDAHMQSEAFRAPVVVTWIALQREFHGGEAIALGLFADGRAATVDMQGWHAIVPVTSFIVAE